MKKLILFCLLALPACAIDTVISAAASAWNTAATWKLAEVGAGAIQVTRSGSTATTTAYVYSTAFTCTNAKVIEGIVMHVAGLGNAGTVSVALSDDGGTTPTKVSTVNASTLSTSQSEVYFALASTLTCDGGPDYKVGVLKDAAGSSGATFYRDGTAGNWFHILQTSTALGAAPAAAANIHVVGFAVTMDSTDSTDHGTVDIGASGSLTFGVTAATAYVLKVSGDINIWSGGTLNVGTVAVAMPSDSSGTILLDCASNVQYGLYVRSGGTFVMQGASKTTWAYLASDEAVNSTEITTAVETSWASGDEIAIATTTRTAAQCEKGDLNGAASGTTVTVHGFGGAGGGLAYAHSGTAPTRAEIVNLTRNVVVKGASASLQGYVYVEATGAVDWDYAEFYWLGSATASKRGIDVAVTTGSFSAVNCSLHDFIVAGSNGITAVAATLDLTLTGNVSYAIGYRFFENAGTAGTFTVTNNVVLKPGDSGILLGDVGGTLTGNVVAGAAVYGFYFNQAATPVSISGNTAHGCTNIGFFIGTAMTGRSTISNSAAWRNSSYGLHFPGNDTQSWLILDGATMFGNTSVNLNIVRGVRLVVKTFASNGDSTFPTTYGLFVGPDANAADLYLYNSDLSYPSGILTPHTYDLYFGTANHLVRMVCGNVKLSSAYPVTYQSPSGITSSVGVGRYGQTATDHRTFFVNGTITSDSFVYRTASLSERIEPSSASTKIESARYPLRVANGETATFSVWTRKSALGDSGILSFTGKYGSGDRTALATVTGNGITSINGPLFVNGNLTDNAGYAATGDVTGKWLKFDFGTALIANQAKLYRGGMTDEKNWKWQGSNNDADWVDLGNVSIDTNLIVPMVWVNTTAYRYYRMIGVSGSSAQSWWNEMEFQIDGGGKAYNGAQQRLILKANPALGIDADVPLDTAAAAVGDWEELTGTSAAVTDNGTLEAVVDCDGTAGWVNVSDWQTAGATTYWLDGLPAYGLGSAAAAATTRSYPVMQ